MTTRATIPLSDAILAGSTLLSFDPSYWYNGPCGHKCGCLIGMGMVAAGYEDELMGTFFQMPIIEKAYPWLAEARTVPLLPRVVKFIAYAHLFGQQKATAAHIISYMAHCVNEDLMTLEQAVDWIRSVEPKPECEFLDDEPILSDVEALASR
jgi:hypothetical protein